MRIHLTGRAYFCHNTHRNGSTEENHGICHGPSWAKPLKFYHKLILKFRIPIFAVPHGWRNNNWKIPDIAIFFKGIFIRASRNDKKMWLLNKIDYFDLYLGAKDWKRKADGEDNDVLNFLLQLFFAAEVMPTENSKKALEMMDKENMKHKLGLYFKPNECQELKELYFQACDKYLS